MKLSTSRLFVAMLLVSPLMSQAATQKEIDLVMAPLQNRVDLQVMLSDDSPLDALGDELTDFVNSVVYRADCNHQQGTVVSFDQQILQDNLTASEIYRILSLFGLQSTISQYQGAEIVNDTDRLLLTGSTLPRCDVATPIALTVTLDENKQADFIYEQQGTLCDGNVELTENSTITYQLVSTKDSPADLRLLGAGFANPFDGHIEYVSVSDDGQTITLRNNIENLGVSKFQFIFASAENDLLLLSPDPQIINRDVK